jgi:CheY-like chemotaxis protein
MAEKLFVILMAEDSEHDIVANKRAFKKNNILNPLYVVRDGEECLDYLHQRGKYSQPGTAPEPGILLLDIRMPKMGGLEVLEQLKADKKHRRLPVVVLTSSQEEEDRLKSYDLGANAYIVKPVGFDNFSQAIKTINLFWQLVDLPNSE